MENNSKNLSVASLVLGIVSVVFSFIWVWLGLAAGIVGIVLAVKARKSAPAGTTGMATAGLVLGIIGTSLSAIMFICAICVVSSIVDVANNLSNY